METADIVCANLKTSCGFNDRNCGQPVNNVYLEVSVNQVCVKQTLTVC